MTTEAVLLTFLSSRTAPAHRLHFGHQPLPLQTRLSDNNTRMTHHFYDRILTNDDPNYTTGTLSYATQDPKDHICQPDASSQ